MPRLSFLKAAGEMSSRIRAFDWRHTPLGPLEDWPDQLLSATAVMLSSPQPIFVGWGPELTLVYNDAFARLLGRGHPKALGTPCRTAWADVWEGYEPVVAKALSGVGSSRQDMLFMSSRSGQGQPAYFTFATSPLFDENGAVGGVLSIVSDTTDRVIATQQAREAAEALAASEERFRQQAERLFALFEKAPGFVAVLAGPEHIVTLTNASYRQLIGDRDVLGLPYREARPELADTGAFELLDRVHATGRSYVGTAASPAAGTPPGGRAQDRYVDFVYEPIRDDAGSVIGVFVQGHDVTDRVLSARKQDLLINELNHRVMNNLATVQSIAVHTAREARDLPQFMDDFKGRIVSLARTHDALTQSGWTGADMHDLLERELVELFPGKIHLEGPSLHLDAGKAQALGLTAHELATNATKYGALGTADGKVRVAWRIEERGDHYVLEWEESGGPPVAPPTRQGYGSRLMARLAKGELGGTLVAEYRPEGLRVRITGLLA